VIEYAVDYAAIDPVKLAFQTLGAETSLPEFFGIKEVPGCRGESSYIVETPHAYIASLTETLGTRSLVADEIYAETGVSHYPAIGQSAAATVFNDLATSGVQAVASFMYLSAGSNAVFEDMVKMRGLGEGWKRACLKVGAVWGGGETPMLRDVVFPNAFEIGGSAWGMLNKPERPLDSSKVSPGDHILLVASSGVHDNGLTLVRDIRSERLKELGYQTPLSNSGQTFGEALMEPTILYGPLVRRFMQGGVKIRSALNITGHGLAKLARATAPFQYRVTVLPRPQPVFPFIQEYSGLPDTKMYSKFNMGAGFAFIVTEDSAGLALNLAGGTGYEIWDGGIVEPSPTGRKQVVLPNGVVFTEKDVAVRH